MNWKELYFGHVSPYEVEEAIKDTLWQSTRISMKGKSVEDKYKTLKDYYKNEIKNCINNRDKRLLQVRVTNYVTALSRGGLIKVSDYR